MMDDGDDGIVSSQFGVQVEEGGMIQLVLEHEIEWETFKLLAQASRPVVGEVTCVATPLQGNDFHLVAALTQVIDEDTVVEKAAGEGVQAAIDNEADPHARSLR